MRVGEVFMTLNVSPHDVEKC